MLKIQRYIKTHKHIVMLQVEDQFAQKWDQKKTSTKILLSVLFWIITWFWWKMMLSILNNERGGTARTKRSTRPCRPLRYSVPRFVLLVKQNFRTWGCVVVPCFCSEGIGRKLPSPEVIFQIPDQQKHDNVNQIQLG